MSIPLNLTLLSKKPQQLAGEVPIEDLGIDLKDELMRVAAPMKYDLNADWMDGAALVQGDVSLPVEYECVRCLKKFIRPVELEGYALHLPLKGEDAVEVVDDCVDLTPFLREDTLLGLPQHPLCRRDCPGIARSENEAEKSGQSGDSVWSQLDNLKLDND